jgi:hypothetical protein
MNDISSNLYPNPTSSIVSFKANEALVWSVFSLNGNIVLEGKIDSAGVVTFNTSEISPGVYFVNMRSSRSVLTSSKRLVILPN